MITGKVTVSPAGYLSVPPPAEVSRVVPNGSRWLRSSFHAITRATAATAAAVGLAVS